MDKKHFSKNYIKNEKTKEKIEYKLQLITHQIEKGFLATNKRRFGMDKVKELIRLLQKYESLYGNIGFAYHLSMSCLTEYKKLYEKNDWTDSEEYEIVKKYLKGSNTLKKLDFGAYNLTLKTINQTNKMDYNLFVKNRHSIRDFSNRNLDEKDIEYAIQSAIATPTACNRQMCKIYYSKSSKNKEIITKYAQGLSLFNIENIQYFLITFDQSSFKMVGERNQGWFNAGLVAMNFVNSLHAVNIGSCFVQFGNSFKEENIIKKELHIPLNERIAIIIAAGYYKENNKVLYSSRKSIEDIYKVV